MTDQMKVSLLLLLIACASCVSKTKYSEPYSDGPVIPTAAYSRAYLNALMHNPWVLEDKTKAAVCGAVNHPQTIVTNPPQTLRQALEIAGIVGKGGFYKIAVWKADEGAFSDAQDGTHTSASKFKRVVSFDSYLKAGDVVVVLERLVIL
jgi:hypothetical protein